MPWFGRLSLDSYRAGPISATEALGQLRTLAAQQLNDTRLEGEGFKRGAN